MRGSHEHDGKCIVCGAESGKFVICDKCYKSRGEATGASPLTACLDAIAKFVWNCRLLGGLNSDQPLKRENLALGIAVMQIKDMEDNSELVSALEKFAADCAPSEPAQEKP